MANDTAFERDTSSGRIASIAEKVAAAALALAFICAVPGVAAGTVYFASGESAFWGAVGSALGWGTLAAGAAALAAILVKFAAEALDARRNAA